MLSFGFDDNKKTFKFIAKNVKFCHDFGEKNYRLGI